MNPIRPTIRKGRFEIFFGVKEGSTIVQLEYNDSVIFEIDVDVSVSRKVSTQEDLLNNYIGFDLITEDMCVFNRRLFYKETSVDADYPSFIRFLVFLKKFQFDQNSNEIFDSNQGFPSFPDLEGFIRRMAFKEDSWSPKTHTEFNNNFRSLIRYMLLSVRFRSQKRSRGVLPITRIPVEVLVFKVFPFLSPFDLHVAQDSFLRLTRRIFSLKEMLKNRYTLFDQFQTEKFLCGTHTPPSSCSAIIPVFEDLNDDERSLLVYEKNLFDIVLETKKLLSSGMNNIHHEWESILRLFNIILLQSIGHKSSKHDDIFDIFETTNFFDILLDYFNKTISEVKFQEKYEYRHLIIMMTDLFRTIFITRRRRIEKNTEKYATHVRNLERTFFNISVKGIIDSFLSSSSSTSSSTTTTTTTRRRSYNEPHFDYELLWENTEKIKYYAVIILKLVKILRVLNKNSFYDQQLREQEQQTSPPPMKYLQGILYIMKEIQRRRYRLAVKKSFTDTLFQIHQNLSRLIIESVSRLVQRHQRIVPFSFEREDVMSEIIRYYHEHILSPANKQNGENIFNNQNEGMISGLDPSFSRFENQKNRSSCISEILFKTFFSESEEEENNSMGATRQLGSVFLRNILTNQSYSWFHKILINYENSENSTSDILLLFRIIDSYLNEVIDFVSVMGVNNNNHHDNFLRSESLWTKRFLNILYQIIESQPFGFLKKHYFGKLILCINTYFRTMRIISKGRQQQQQQQQRKRRQFFPINNNSSSRVSNTIMVTQFLERGILVPVSKENVKIEEILDLVENRNFQVWFCAMESRKNRRDFGNIIMLIISSIIERWEMSYDFDEEIEHEDEEDESNYYEIIEYLRNELEFIKNLIDVDRKVEKKRELFHASIQTSTLVRQQQNFQNSRWKKEKKKKKKKDEQQPNLYELTREAWNVLASSSTKRKRSISDQISSLSLFNFLFKSRRKYDRDRIKHREDLYHQVGSHYSSPVAARRRSRVSSMYDDDVIGNSISLGVSKVVRKSLTKIGNILYRFILPSNDDDDEIITGDPLKELRKKKTIKLVNLIIEEYGRIKNNIPLSESEESDPFYACGLEKWIVKIVLGMVTKKASQMIVRATTDTTSAETKIHLNNSTDKKSNEYWGIVKTVESVLSKCYDDDEVITEFFNNESVFIILFENLEKKVRLQTLSSLSFITHNSFPHRNNNELNLVLDCFRYLLHRPYEKIISFESDEKMLSSFPKIFEEILQNHTRDMNDITTEQEKEMDKIASGSSRKEIKRVYSRVQRIFRFRFSYPNIILIREFLFFFTQFDERFVKMFEQQQEILKKIMDWVFQIHELQLFQESFDQKFSELLSSSEQEEEEEEDGESESDSEEFRGMIIPPPVMMFQYLKEFREFFYSLLRRVIVFGGCMEMKSDLLNTMMTKKTHFMKSFFLNFLSVVPTIQLYSKDGEEEFHTRNFFCKNLHALTVPPPDNDNLLIIFTVLMDIIGDILEVEGEVLVEEEDKKEEELLRNEQQEYLHDLKDSSKYIIKLEILISSATKLLDRVQASSTNNNISFLSSRKNESSIVMLTCLYKHFSLQRYYEDQQINDVFLNVLKLFYSRLGEKVSVVEKEKLDRLVEEKLHDDVFTKKIDFKISVLSNNNNNNGEENSTRTKENGCGGKRIEEVEVEYEEHEKKDFDSFFWDQQEEEEEEIVGNDGDDNITIVEDRVGDNYYDKDVTIIEDGSLDFEEERKELEDFLNWNDEDEDDTDTDDDDFLGVQ